MKKLPVTSEFARRLNGLMEKRGISKKELAEMLKCSIDTIYKWDRREYDFVPVDYYIKKLSKFFNVDYAYLSLAQEHEHINTSNFPPGSVEDFIFSNSHFTDFLREIKNYYNSFNDYQLMTLEASEVYISEHDFREVYKNKAATELNGLLNDLCKWDPILNKSIDRLSETFYQVLNKTPPAN